MDFVDTDVLIQIHRGKSLQQIINESDYLNLRSIEEAEILKMDVKRHVIATGGSAVYSSKAMQHLSRLSTVVFLKVSFAEIKRRIHNFETRGIAKAVNQTFKELYAERQVLYLRYAQLVIHCDNPTQDEIAEIVASSVQELQAAL